MEYKNIVLKNYWDQPIVQVFAFLRNKQLLSVVTSSKSMKSQAGFSVCLVKIGIEDFDMNIPMFVLAVAIIWFKHFRWLSFTQINNSSWLI